MMGGPIYSEEQRERFFEIFDRGGTVRAAARSAGVSEHAAYRWVSASGLSMFRATPRKYTSEEKVDFFQRLAVNPNVSAVAKEMGIPRVTCYAWAHKAGIFTSEARKTNPRREEFLRLRAQGLTRAEARKQVGADARSATDWDKGITIINRGRVYPDGRVVRYPEPIMSGVPERRTRAIGGSVDLNKVEQIIDSRYLSLLEREQLQDLRRDGQSIRQIAAAMGRSPSTISRELRRNTTWRGYMPHTAHRMSVARRARPRQAKLVADPRLREYVQVRLKKKWSPQQISNRLIKDFPAAPEMRVCPETIYQAIYVHAKGELRRELSSQLRRGRTARRPRQQPDARRPRFVDPLTPISERPIDATDRKVPGHWEGDLVIGAAGGSAVATLVERTSRYLLLGHLGRERSAEAVRDSLIATVSDMPAAMRRSLTWDQGAEMAEHRAFSIATDFEVYFADPGAPWQRGTNENTNGLLRQHFPRGVDLSSKTIQDLQDVATELNDRPRKALDWDTPAERWAQLLCAT